MAALSLTSAAPSNDPGAGPGGAAAVPSMGGAVLPVSLPLRFVLFGLACLFGGVVLLVARPALLATYHYNQHIIAVTHLFTLGFITSVIMGAMYQLVPVALETRLHSQRLAKWQFAIHAVGVIGMVWMFWRWDMKQVGHFGTVLAAGVGFFVYNLARTLRTVPRWNIIATSIASALAWLSLTALAGLAIAAAKSSYETEDQLAGGSLTAALVGGLQAVAGFLQQFDAIGTMHAHAHLGGIGFFVMLIVGISYRLVPMFTLSEVQSTQRARASVWLLNVGLPALFLAVLCRSRLKPAAALVVVAGLCVYFVELRAMLRARRRRKLDWAVRYFISALVVLGLCCVLGMILSWPGLPLNARTGQLENLYGFLAFIGVIALAILGMLYKIIPFLIWYATYSPEIGRRKVPLLADLYSPQLQAAGYWSYLAALAVTSSAILAGSTRAMPWGCGLLLMSLLVFAANAARMLSHLARPRLGPLPQPCLQPPPQ